MDLSLRHNPELQNPRCLLQTMQKLLLGSGKHPDWRAVGDGSGSLPLRPSCPGFLPLEGNASLLHPLPVPSSLCWTPLLAAHPPGPTESMTCAFSGTLSYPSALGFCSSPTGNPPVLPSQDPQYCLLPCTMVASSPGPWLHEAAMGVSPTRQHPGLIYPGTLNIPASGVECSGSKGASPHSRAALWGGTCAPDGLLEFVSKAAFV